MLGSSKGCTPGQKLLERWKTSDEVVVHLAHDGGEEDPVDLNRQDEREVKQQGGGVPQQHLQAFDEANIIWCIIYQTSVQ